MIKVAQVIGKWIGGGAESVVMTYFRNIDKSSFSFDFICESDSTNIPYEEIEKLGGRVIIVSPYEDTKKYVKELTAIFKNGNYDIVHSHIDALSYLSLKAAKKAKIPVRIAHSHIPSTKLEMDHKFLKDVYRPLVKVNATHYFACSEVSARFLFGDKAFEKGKVFIIKNAIDLSYFKYNEKIRIKKRKELGIKDDEIVIGHIGRFVNQKNHEFILELFKNIRDNDNDVVLLLAGQGPLMTDIREKAYVMGIYDKIKFLGQVNNINKLYQAMDVFILPSFYEGNPITLIEAQCASLPCIVSEEVGESSKLLSSTTLMSLNSPLDIWSKIIIDAAQKGKRIDRTNTLKREGYDINIVIKKLEKKYRELVNK